MKMMLENQKDERRLAGRSPRPVSCLLSPDSWHRAPARAVGPLRFSAPSAVNRCGQQPAPPPLRVFVPSCLTNRRSGITPVSRLPSPVSRASARAFTLVELMAVMTIMLIMAVITIPAFAKMFQNNNQVAAMNEISAMISQGRALALKMHQQVAVVFYEETTANVPTGSSAYTGETAIALAIAPQGQPENGSSTSTPLYFEPYLAAPVQYLPKGMVVAALTSTTAGVSGLLNVATNGSTAGQCRAIVFDAAGHMVLRSYLDAMPNPDGAVDYVDWQFNGTLSAVSSPGVMAYEPSALPASATASSSALAAYLTANNDVFIVNSYTGDVLR